MRVGISDFKRDGDKDKDGDGKDWFRIDGRASAAASGWNFCHNHIPDCDGISDVNRMSTRECRSECTFISSGGWFRSDRAAMAASEWNYHHLHHGPDRDGDLCRSRHGSAADASSSTAKAGTGAAAALRRLYENESHDVSMESSPKST